MELAHLRTDDEVNVEVHEGGTITVTPLRSSDRSTAVVVSASRNGLKLWASVALTGVGTGISAGVLYLLLQWLWPTIRRWATAAGARAVALAYTAANVPGIDDRVYQVVKADRRTPKYTPVLIVNNAYSSEINPTGLRVEFASAVPDSDLGMASPALAFGLLIVGSALLNWRNRRLLGSTAS